MWKKNLKRKYDFIKKNHGIDDFGDFVFMLVGGVPLLGGFVAIVSGSLAAIIMGHLFGFEADRMWLLYYWLATCSVMWYFTLRGIFDDYKIAKRTPKNDYLPDGYTIGYSQKNNAAGLFWGKTQIAVLEGDSDLYLSKNYFYNMAWIHFEENNREIAEEEYRQEFYGQISGRH